MHLVCFVLTVFSMSSKISRASSKSQCSSWHSLSMSPCLNSSRKLLARLCRLRTWLAASSSRKTADRLVVRGQRVSGSAGRMAMTSSMYSPTHTYPRERHALQRGTYRRERRSGGAAGRRGSGGETRTWPRMDESSEGKEWSLNVEREEGRSRGQ